MNSISIEHPKVIVFAAAPLIVTLIGTGYTEVQTQNSY